MEKIEFDKLQKKFNGYFVNKVIKKDRNFLFLLKQLINKYNLLNDVNKKNYSRNRLIDSQNVFLYYPITSKHVDESLIKKSVTLFTHELSRTGAPIVALDTAKILLDSGYFVLIVSQKKGPLLDEFLNYGIPVIIEENLIFMQYKTMDSRFYFDYLVIDTLLPQFDRNIFVSLTLYNYVKRFMNTNISIIWWIHEGSEFYTIFGKKLPKSLSSNINVYYGGEYSINESHNNNFFYPCELLNYGVTDKYNRKLQKKEREKVVFLLVGTIGIRKGQLLLLNAIKELDLKFKAQSKFIFIGDVYENNLDGKIIKKEMLEYSKKDSCVRIIDSIPRDELFAFYEDSDVLIVPSIDDPMPVVATENLMFKNICLCSDQTGTSYYIENGINGFVFKSGNVESLKSQIEFILSHKDGLEAIKEKGRKTYEDVFDMEIFKKRIICLLEKNL